jgi:NADPH-dependent glutamate synthase beta subunit-like oxidoreductase
MAVEVRVEIPDRNYWKSQIKCQSACPVQTDARGYIRAIAEGNDELAYLIARGPNPLASICGRVCGAPCEVACRRGDYDKPVAIRTLKRYICERFGPESRHTGGKNLLAFLKDAAQRHAPHDCQAENELLPLLQALTSGSVKPVENKSVGIIGSGPAGLAAAHDLALLGFEVTIYEMESVLAGMLAVGVPEYRLPRDLIRAEVEVITSLGVKAETNCCVGKDVTFPELRKRHDCVIVAVGAKKSRHLPMPGADGKGVLGGVEFLREVSLGRPPSLGSKVVVVGGGNVAYDVGRTVLRQIALDAARTAVLAPGVGEVSLCSLESLEEMPADDAEIIEGDEEGVIRRNSLGPKAILLDDEGNVQAIQFQKCLRVFDEDRRFNPQFDEDDVTEIECDNVIISIGQSFDISFIDAERDGLTVQPNGMLECDGNTGATNASDVFVAGDLAYGTKLLIHAVASGKAVARSIYKNVTGKEIQAGDIELHFPIPDYSREWDYEKTPRVTSVSAPVEQRLTGQDRIVEMGMTEEQARLEAARCLNCGVNTVFDGMRCILCGGCVDVCPEVCLRILPLSEIDTAPENRDALDAICEDVSLESASAIIKDETICIRCALCAERCPTGAITMEQFHFEEAPQCLVD